MNDLEKRVTAIESRNQKVELEKAWEVSWTRRITIALLTYIVVAIYLVVIHNSTPFVNAAVPAVGFLLSTLVLPQVKTIWHKKRND